MTERRVIERLCRIHPVNLRNGSMKRFQKPNRVMDPKKAGSRSLLTGSWIGGIELKDRSAGGWRSGLQRSEK